MSMPVERIVKVPVEVEKIVYRDKIIYQAPPEEEEESEQVWDLRTVMIPQQKMEVCFNFSSSYKF